MAAEPTQVWDSIADLFPTSQDASQLEVFLQDEALEPAGNLHFDDRSASSSWPSPSTERALHSSPSTPAAYLPRAWDAEGLSHARLSFSLSVPAECAMKSELLCPPRRLDPLDLPHWGPMPAHNPSSFGATRLEISPQLPVESFDRAMSCNLDQLGTLSGYPLASTRFLQSRQDFTACGDGLRSFSLPVTGLDAACLSAAQQPAQTSRKALGGMEQSQWGTDGAPVTAWALGNAAEAEPVPEPQSWTEDPPLKRARSNASSNSTYSATGTAAMAVAADSALRPVVAAPQGKRVISGKGDFTFPVYKPKRRESFAPPLRCHIRTNALHFPDAIFATETSSGDRQWLGRSGSGVESRKSSDSQGTFFSCPKVTEEGLRSKRKRSVRSTASADHSMEE